MPVDRALELAGDTGRRAYAARVPLAQLVEVVAGLVPDTAPDTRALPAQLIEAAATHYFEAESADSSGDLPRPGAP